MTQIRSLTVSLGRVKACSKIRKSKVCGSTANRTLFPRYLSFVKGVVDSNDLPLNVSREILQESRIVRIMRKRLDCENKEDYKKFWENFGRFMKLGCIEDSGNHKCITPLLRFFTSKSEEELKSLEKLVQKDIEAAFEHMKGNSVCLIGNGFPNSTRIASGFCCGLS